MKAFALVAYDRLQLADIPTPVPADDEVLVRVRATSINPYDTHILHGEPFIARLMPGSLGLRTPKLASLGCDVAGQVSAIGTDVRQFRPGDDVFALIEQGGFGEYVSVPERLLAPKPKNLSYEQAAAVPMAGVTALLGVCEMGRLQPGQKVLVNGAAGGVGTFAVQLARAFGATVTGVCGTRNVDLVRSIGAETVIDYTRQDFTRSGQRYDLLIDVAGNRSAVECRRVLAPKGTLVLIGGPAGRWFQPVSHMFGALALAPLMSQRIALTDTVRSPAKRQSLVTLTNLIEEGKVTPVIDRQFQFEELPAAIGYQEKGHVSGKVVVAL